MHYSSTVFGQLLSLLPRRDFARFVGQYEANRYVKKFDAWNQLVLLLYAQATGKESLRDIETSCTLSGGAWYHLGVRSVARSTLSDAMNRRDWRIFEKLFYALLGQCRSLVPHRQFDFDNPLYSLDSTTVELCLSLFDWARFRTRKGALKMHTLLNNRSAVPEFLLVSEGRRADIAAIRHRRLPLEKGSILIFDRGYTDYAWWQKLDAAGVFFVTRPRSNQAAFVAGEHRAAEGAGILADELISIGEYHTMHRYPKLLRRVRYWSEEDNREYLYLTNNFILTASQIVACYRERWQIELFFKWIKQNLKVKSFLGTSRNAVLSQIWAAMIYYLLLAYLKFQTRFERSLLELARMVRETLLVRRSLLDLLSLNHRTLHRFRPPETVQLALL